MTGSGRARNGVSKRAYEHVFKQHGLVKVKLGRGVKPTWSEAHRDHGDCIVSTRKHLSAITGGKVRDTHDERGYWWSEKYGETVGSNYDQVPAASDAEWRERKAMSIWVAA